MSGIPRCKHTHDSRNSPRPRAEHKHRGWEFARCSVRWPGLESTELARPRAIDLPRLPFDRRRIPACTGELLTCDQPPGRGRFRKECEAFGPIIMVILNNGQ